MVDEPGRRRGELDAARQRRAMRSTNDTDLVTALLAHHPDRSLEAARARGAAAAARRLLASSGWTRTRCTPPATRRASARWCSAGSSAAGWSPSETAALDIVGASLRPRGRARRADRHRRERPAHRSASPRPTPKGCLFEYVYLARPDTTIAGRSVHERPGRDRPPARPRVPGRGRPGDPGAGVRHARPRSGTPRRAASPTARAW